MRAWGQEWSLSVTVYLWDIRQLFKHTKLPPVTSIPAGWLSVHVLLLPAVTKETYIPPPKKLTLADVHLLYTGQMLHITMLNMKEHRCMWSVKFPHSSLAFCRSNSHHLHYLYSYDSAQWTAAPLPNIYLRWLSPCVCTTLQSRSR